MDTPATRKEMGSKNSVLGVCSAQQRALPTIRFLSSSSIGILEEEGETYISEIQIYTERPGFLPCRIQ